MDDGIGPWAHLPSDPAPPTQAQVVPVGQLIDLGEPVSDEQPHPAVHGPAPEPTPAPHDQQHHSDEELGAVGPAPACRQAATEPEECSTSTIYHCGRCRKPSLQPLIKGQCIWCNKKYRGDTASVAAAPKVPHQFVSLRALARALRNSFLDWRICPRAADYPAAQSASIGRASACATNEVLFF